MVDRTFNYDEIKKDLETICLHCPQCLGKNCLIGFSKICVQKCKHDNISFVENAKEQIPPADMRGGYDEYTVLHAISHLLYQCKSCKENHFENCIINTVRNCLEVIEFGEERDYEGTPLSYMVAISSENGDKGDVIRSEYQNTVEKNMK